MKKYAAITAATAFLLIASLLSAQPRHRQMQGQGPGGGPHMGAVMAEELELTDAQKEQIQAIHSNARKENIDRQAKMKIARIELHELMAADTPDQGKVDAKVNELSKLHTAMLQANVSNQLAVQKILTPEQRKKAKSLRMQHSGKGARGKGMRGKGGPPHGQFGGPRGGAPFGGPGFDGADDQDN